MTNELEIFDRYGNKMHIANLIYNFIKDRAEKHNKDIHDTCVGIGTGCLSRKPYIYTIETVGNGYDGWDLLGFGEALEVVNDRDLTSGIKDRLNVTFKNLFNFSMTDIILNK